MDQNVVKVLCLGDVVGRPGRQALRSKLMALREARGIDCVIANCENIAGGSGVTVDTADELFTSGVDVLTSGNHVWRKKEAFELLERDHRLIRPANYPEGVAGSGSTVIETLSGVKIGVLNLMGRVFMDSIDCPFQVAESEIKRLKEETSVVVVDMHAEATSEKVVMGWFLDGKVSAVFGTHTHIQTADERILPAGTGYITDVGMTGPYQSIIGMRADKVVRRFLLQSKASFEVAKRDVRLAGIVVDIDEHAGRAQRLERLLIAEDDQA